MKSQKRRQEESTGKYWKFLLSPITETYFSIKTKLTQKNLYREWQIFTNRHLLIRLRIMAELKDCNKVPPIGLKLGNLNVYLFLCQIFSQSHLRIYKLRNNFQLSLMNLNRLLVHWLNHLQLSYRQMVCIFRTDLLP